MAEKKKVNWTFVVLIVVLVLAVGYIGVTEYVNWKRNQDIQAYQQGMRDASLQIAQKAAQCQTVPLNVGNNQTVTLASMKCVQKQLQQTQQPPAQQRTSGNGSQQLLNA